MPGSPASTTSRAARRRTTSSKSPAPAWRRSTTTATACRTSTWSTARRSTASGRTPRRLRQRSIRNLGGGHFRDVTAEAGVANERWGQGVCAGDFDNDGDRGSVRHQLRSEQPVPQRGRPLHRCRDERGRRRRQLVDRLRVRRLRRRRLARPLRRRLRRARSRSTCRRHPHQRTDCSPVHQDSSKAPVGAVRRRAGGQVGMGAAYSAGAAFCTYRGETVMCGPRGLPGRARSPVPQQPRRHVHRRHAGGRRHRREQRLYGFGVAWFDMDDDGRLDLLRGQRLGPEPRLPQPRERHVRGRQLCLGRRARRQRARRRRTWASPSATTTTTAATTCTSPTSPTTSTCSTTTTTARSFTDVSYPRRRGAAVDSVPRLGHELPRLRQRRLARSARRQRPRLPGWPIACPGTRPTRSARCCSGTWRQRRFEDVGAGGRAGADDAARRARLRDRRLRQRRRRRPRRQHARLGAALAINDGGAAADTG